MKKDKLGNYSVYLILLVPILFFIARTLLNTLYLDIPSGDSIPKDVIARPGVAIPMLLGMLSGVASFITGLIAIIKNKNYNILVIGSTILGALMTFFVIANIVVPLLKI
jgi:hypothetical protein